MDGEDGILARLRSRLSALRRSSDPQGPPITVVSGLPRSGTSMMMQALERGGLDPLRDGQREPDDDNPEGYYEYERVKGLPEGDTEWLEQARGRAVKVISALLGHLPGDGSYEVLFMRRDLGEVLASQRQMLDRREQEAASEEEILRREFLDHIDEVRTSASNRDEMRFHEVDYNRVLQSPREEFARVEGFLTPELDVDAMAEVVDPDLYRQRS